MTKNVSATTHTFDHGAGVFRTGAPVVVGDRPYILLTGNNPHLASLNANYAGSTFKGRVDHEVSGGTDNYEFPDRDVALGYAIEGDTAVGQFAVDRVDIIVSDHEAAFASFVGGNVSPMKASGIFAFDRCLYAHLRIKDICTTFDMCYDLLTPSQRTRWMDVAMQIMYAVLLPYEARITSSGSAVDWEDTPGGNNPYTWAHNVPDSNYHHHHIGALVMCALAFKDMPAITYSMQGGDVALDSDYWLNHLTTVQLPAMVTVFDQMPGGGSIEGSGYGKAIDDLFLSRAMMKWSTGVDHFASISTYLDNSEMWRVFITPPDLYGANSVPLTVTHGRNAAEPLGVITIDEVYTHATALASDPSHPYAGEIKKLISELEYYPSGGIWSRFEGIGFIMRPAYDATTESATYNNLPRVHASSAAGDNILRTGWDAGDTMATIRSGALHSGNHAHDDSTSVLLWKNGFLIGHGQPNRASYDHSFGGGATANDLLDRAQVSLVGVGNNTAVREEDNQQPFTYLPTTHYVQDNSGTDGDLYASVDCSPVYSGTNVTKQQRDIVLIDDVLLVFDRVECTSGENVVLQWNTHHDSTISGDAFTWSNGTSSAELDLLTHTANWTKTNIATSVNLGTGTYQHRADLGNGTTHSILTSINIDGAATSVVLGTPVAGETTAIITYVGGATKTVTFYDTQARRSVS
jgi:hypothetical protein